MAKVNKDIETHNDSLGLKPAWGKNNGIVLTFQMTHDGEKRRPYSQHIATHNFAAVYAAKKFIEAVIGDDPVKWTGPDQLTIRQWITVSSADLSKPSLEAIMEHEYTKAEAKWQLPTPYTSYAVTVRRYHRGAHPDFNAHERELNGKPRLTPEEYAEAFPWETRKEKLPEKAKQWEKKPEKVVKEKKQRAEKAPRASKDGLTTLAEICVTLKIDPREARAALRGAKIDKPPTGSWAWEKSKIAEVTKLIQKAMKSEQEAKTVKKKKG